MADIFTACLNSARCVGRARRRLSSANSFSDTVTTSAAESPTPAAPDSGPKPPPTREDDDDSPADALELDRLTSTPAPLRGFGSSAATPKGPPTPSNSPPPPPPPLPASNGELPPHGPPASAATAAATRDRRVFRLGDAADMHCTTPTQPAGLGCPPGARGTATPSACHRSLPTHANLLGTSVSSGPRRTTGKHGIRSTITSRSSDSSFPAVD